MEKAIAVVVTYNRRALLSECITALRNQTRRPDAILVVNNGSTDDTASWLEQQSDLIFINQNNLGSSGGFSTGIKWAYQEGYSWIWCMDDDGYPKENALENLLKADDGCLRLLNCAVIDKEDKKSFVWKTQHYKTLDEVDCKLIDGIGHPFNGTLLHRRIVERVGVPKPNYFLWGDETEYYYRIVKRDGIPVSTVANSIHYHPSTAFSVKKDWDFNSGWKMYYYVRNRFFIHQAKFNNKAVALFNYCCFLVAFAGIIMLYQKTDKLKKLSFIMWPVTDAFNKNFEATPPSIITKLKTNETFSLAGSINSYIKNTLLPGLPSFTTGRLRRAANA
jgi:rhamnopyranosyl-N-acetylglucosaminyl-diphospho-decaprenol beta-1,3/1,4-galactofuranosyltransferase